MSFRYVDRITPDLLDRALHDGATVAFGDNLAGWGRGGQARHARGHPAAVGIATKRSPRAYLTDEDFPEWIARTAKAWRLLRLRASLGDPIWWPRDGIGTGRARLREKAPMIADEIEARRQRLEVEAYLISRARKEVAR